MYHQSIILSQWIEEGKKRCICKWTYCFQNPEGALPKVYLANTPCDGQKNLCMPARELTEWDFSLTCSHQSCLLKPVGYNKKSRNANFFSHSSQTARKRLLSASIQNNPRSDFLGLGCRGQALQCTTFCHFHISWFSPGYWFTPPTCWVIIHYLSVRFVHTVTQIAVFNLWIVEVQNLRWLPSKIQFQMQSEGVAILRQDCTVLLGRCFERIFHLILLPFGRQMKYFLSIWVDMHLGFYT